MPQRNRQAHDARLQRSRETVLGAAYELLTELGLGGVTIEEVARRSGVAKTTIYRHWPTRTELILDTAPHISAAVEAPDTGDLGRDLATLLAEIADLLKTARWSSVVPSIVDAAERDPQLAAVHSRIQRGHMAPVKKLIGRGVAQGALPPGTDVEAMTSMLIGPLYYRRWFSREAIDPPFVGALVESALAYYKVSVTRRAE